MPLPLPLPLPMACAFVSTPLVLVVVRLGMLARPWLLPADRGLGEDAVRGGGEIVDLWPALSLCSCACGCEARLTKPSCICCGGE